MDPFPIYYSIGDIAERTGFHRNTVDNWYRDGALSRPQPVLRIGDDLRVPWVNVEEFLRRHELPCVADESRPRRKRAVAPRAAGKPICARNAGELRRKLQAAEEAP